MNTSLKSILNQNAYVKIYSKKCIHSPQRLELPFVVGSSSKAHLIINSPNLPDVAKLVFFKDDNLYMYDLKTNKIDPAYALSNYGINFVGPILYDNPNKGGLKRFIKELLALEKYFFTKLPLRLQKLLGARFSQSTRLTIWAVVLLFLIIVINISFPTTDKAKVIDRSQQPIDITLGKAFTSTMGSVPTYREFAKGITYVFNLHSSDVEQDLALNFEIKWLDIDKEIEILINQQSVYSYTLDKSCISNFCSQVVIIPKNVLVAGKNVITIVHNDINSDYAIKNIFLDKAKSLSSTEEAMLERWILAAQRYYDEKDISLKNIIYAKTEIQKAINFLNTRTNADEYKRKILPLAKDIESAFKNKITDLWFDAEKALKLGDIDVAKEIYNILLEVYSDHPFSSEYQKVKQLLNEIDAMEQQK